MRYFLAIFAVGILAAVGILGFRGSHFRKPPLRIFPDMEFQLKLRPQYPSDFFENGRSSQPAPAGTVARATPLQTADGPAWPFEDKPVFSGRLPGSTNYVEHNPLPVTSEMLKRGQQRFTINCAPCHGATGDGNGITRKIGAMAVVGNLHDRRMVEMADGELFWVISHGRNLMGPYASTVTPADRWAIVAYVRALQLARLGDASDLPPADRATLTK